MNILDQQEVWQILQKIEEVKSVVEREIEWPATDYVEKKAIANDLTHIYVSLLSIGDTLETYAQEG